MELQYFKSLIREYLGEKNLTLSSLATQANLSEDTLRSVLYGKSQDIKLSTMIKIADVFGCSLDELVNRQTYSKSDTELFNRIHHLSPASKRMVEAIVEFEEITSLTHSVNGEMLIPVLIPNGNLKDGIFYDCNHFEQLDISEYPNAIRGKIDFGFKILSENFIPNYYPNDILLLTRTRIPEHGDHILYLNRENQRLHLRKYTANGLEPINGFGKRILPEQNHDYTAMGIVLRTMKEFNIEQYR